MKGWPAADTLPVGVKRVLVGRRAGLDIRTMGFNSGLVEPFE
jgi:hypothetical protein